MGDGAFMCWHFTNPSPKQNGQTLADDNFKDSFLNGDILILTIFFIEHK